MPRRDRDYDDDDDRDNDRPHRRESSNKTLWIVLGVVGGTILLSIVACAGLIMFGAFRATQAINQSIQSIGGMTSAEAFMTDLQADRIDLAYDSTSQNFKSRQSRAQFQDFVKQNPILSKHGSRSMNSFDTTGEPPKQKVVVRFRLHVDAIVDDEPDMDDPQMKQPGDPFAKEPEFGKGIKGKVKPKPKAPPLTDRDCTITMIEENGVWKLDQISIP